MRGCLALSRPWFGYGTAVPAECCFDESSVAWCGECLPAPANPSQATGRVSTDELVILHVSDHDCARGDHSPGSDGHSAQDGGVGPQRCSLEDGRGDDAPVGVAGPGVEVVCEDDARADESRVSERDTGVH